MALGALVAVHAGHHGIATKGFLAVESKFDRVPLPKAVLIHPLSQDNNRQRPSPDARNLGRSLHAIW